MTHAMACAPGDLPSRLTDEMRAENADIQRDGL